MSMEEKSNLEQFLELTKLLGNDEMIDPEEEAQFWKSEAGQKMSRAFNSPEHREFLRKLDELRTKSSTGDESMK